MSNVCVNMCRSLPVAASICCSDITLLNLKTNFLYNNFSHFQKVQIWPHWQRIAPYSHNQDKQLKKKIICRYQNGLGHKMVCQYIQKLISINPYRTTNMRVTEKCLKYTMSPWKLVRMIDRSHKGYSEKLTREQKIVPLENIILYNLMWHYLISDLISFDNF